MGWGACGRDLGKEARSGAEAGWGLKIGMRSSYRCKRLLYHRGRTGGFGSEGIGGFEGMDEFIAHYLRRSQSAWPER